MNSRRLQFGLAALAIGFTIVAGTGCSPDKAIISPKTNQRPVLELTRAPFNETTRFEYQYRMNWLGYDPDGRIDRYLYAIDPPSPTAANPEPDTAWVATNRSEQLLNFSATKLDTIRAGEDGASDFHTFVVKAIDNGGLGGPLQSVPLIRSFFTYTIAPTVQILRPAPSDRGRAYVTPAVRITWTGTDEDGILNNQKPNKYKFILLTQNSAVPFQIALTNPDSVRRYYAPRNWAGWDSTGADTTTKQFTNLVPLQDYMFCVIAFDEAGAYSPVFTQNSNMLNMRVTYAAVGGPKLTVFSDIFFYAYDVPVYSSLPQYQIKIEVPANEELQINWFGVAVEGADVRGYRWTLDIDDLSDQTPRTNERTDVRHWSQLSNATTATIGPFGGGETHLFYIEAEDNNGVKSLATVNISVVLSSLEKPLLVVNDTRLFVDMKTPTTTLCMNAPTNRWPSAAELDTFLFARGGFPWRCYPTGATTTPGLFAGYPFDTTGTRTGLSEVRVPLAKVGQYQHVVWLTDSRGGINSDPGTNVAGSIGALRYMNVPGRANSLAAYIKQGGMVWLAGGGAAYATLFPYNRTNNDIGGMTFGFENNELVPGRFLFDIFKWQSEVKVATGPIFVTRNFGRYTERGIVPAPYARLPLQLRPKTQALDPFPPGRSFNVGNFYLTNFDVEYLSQPNYVYEDVNPDILITDMQSTLDTLYYARGNVIVQPELNLYNVCMTRYVGPSYTPVVFTGFSIWTWTRADCKAMVDAVLQDMWGLPYTPPVANGTASATPVRREERMASATPPVRAGTGGAMTRKR